MPEDDRSDLIAARLAPRRVLHLLFALALIATATGFGKYPGATLIHADQPTIPLGVVILLPPGTQVEAAKAADLTGSGVDDWAVVSVPTDGLFTPTFTLAVPSATGWTVSQTTKMDSTASLALQIVAIAGVPAVVLAGGVGAHSGRTVIWRWDGSTFATIFDGFSDGVPPRLQDIDGDGIPEIVGQWSPYCRDHAESPELPSLFQWNGASYVDYAAPYPSSLIAPYAAQVSDALSRAHVWSTADLACLYQSAAYLATKQGDPATAASSCQKAADIDPGSAQTGIEDFFCPSSITASGGAITGHLFYPSEGVPALGVYAIRLNDDGTECCYAETFTQNGQETYSLDDLGPGTYIVASYRLVNNNNIVGGHTNFGECLAANPMADCSGEDHAMLPVTIQAGSTTDGVDIADFNAPTSSYPPMPGP